MFKTKIIENNDFTKLWRPRKSTKAYYKGTRLFCFICRNIHISEINAINLKLVLVPLVIKTCKIGSKILKTTSPCHYSIATRKTCMLSALTNLRATRLNCLLQVQGTTRSYTSLDNFLCSLFIIFLQIKQKTTLHLTTSKQFKQMSKE